MSGLHVGLYEPSVTHTSDPDVMAARNHSTESSVSRYICLHIHSPPKSARMSQKDAGNLDESDIEGPVLRRETRSCVVDVPGRMVHDAGTPVMLCT